MTVATSVVSRHIEIDDKGVAWITGANTKVVEVVLDKLAYGWSPEEIHFQHPHLSLAQIHSALAYYYDHQEKLDSEMEERRQEAEQLRAKVTNPALRQKLLNLKMHR
jgi:uncharacterized protein (DUF433 family)